MGFRMYQNPQDQDTEKGTKLRVIKVGVPIYHYSCARPPKKMTAKRIEFHKKYTDSDAFIADVQQKEAEGYSYREYDNLKTFRGTHPAVMKDVVAAQDWTFVYDPKKNNMSAKEKVMKAIEDLTGRQFFTYKNYKIVG